MSQYFNDFYHILLPHLRGYTVEEFFNNVFSWYKKDQNAEDNHINKRLLERWINERGIPRPILLQALNSPNTAAEQYDSVFRDFDEKLQKDALESYDMLSGNLKDFMDSLPLTVSFDYDYVQLTKVFTTCLVCDGIVGEETLIEAGLRNSVRNVLAACRKDNKTFSTMYILGILLNSPYRLLGHMLENCAPVAVNGGETVNLKSKWDGKVKAYVEKKDHKKNLPVALNDIVVFQQAKLVAYSLENKPRIAGELEVCKAIVRCPDDSSSAIRSLKADLGEMANPVKWDALADKCYEKMYRTSI